MGPFRSIPDGNVTLMNVTVPGFLIGRPEDLVTTRLHLNNGRISDTGGVQIDMARAMVFPCFTDMHTHLDKGHIWPRAANPDGTFYGALTTVGTDRAARTGPPQTSPAAWNFH